MSRLSNLFFFGSRRNDDITGTNSRNFIFGGGGNDVINGLGGNDKIWGGRGDDQLFGGDGHDFLSGDKGDDILDGGSGRDFLLGGRGDDTLIWTAAENTQYRADWYNGGRGQDTLFINLTASEYTEDVRLEILEFLDFVADNLHGNGDVKNKAFSFDMLNLNVSGVEFVQVNVDGVEVDVTAPPNTAPTAFEVNAAADENAETVLIAANVIDPDAGDTLSYTVDTSSTLGSVTNNGDGTFSYDPNGQFDDLEDGETATDTFTYTVDDGNGGVSTATATITINGVTANEAPVVGVSDVFFDGRNVTFDPFTIFDPDGDDFTVELNQIDGPIIGSGPYSRIYFDTASLTLFVSLDTSGEPSDATSTWELIVTDARGAITVETFTITTGDFNDIPPPPPPPPPPGQDAKADMSHLESAPDTVETYDLSEFVSDEDYFVFAEPAENSTISSPPDMLHADLHTDFASPSDEQYMRLSNPEQDILPYHPDDINAPDDWLPMENLDVFA